MTITANPVRNQYTAAPNQTVFNYTYKIYSDNDLNVYVTPAGQAPNDSADLITSYTVDPGTIGNQGGGFITLDTGANSGDIITIASAIQYDRETDYQTNGDFSPETVNGDIDRVVSLVKQNKGDINRAILLPESAEEGSEPVSIPSPDDQKGLKWDGGNLVNTSIVEEVTTDSAQYQLVSVSGNDVKIRGLKPGQNVTLTDDGTDILIKAEVQGGQGDVSSSSNNTYAPGTTQEFAAATADSISTTSATADTLSVDGVDFTAKNAEQDEAIEDAQATADSVVNAIPFTKTVTSTSITHEATKNSTYKINSTMSVLFTGSGGICGINISVSGAGSSNVRIHTISINDSSGEIDTGSYGGIGNISISGSSSGNPSAFTGFLNGTFTVLSGDTITITPFESASSASIINSVLTLQEMTG